MIPIVRIATWYEYFVWVENPGVAIKFAHVRDPRIFKILDELYRVCNCHRYENLIGDAAISKIAESIDNIISGKCIGVVEHLTLASGPNTLPVPSGAPPASGWLAQVPPFYKSLEVVHLNALYKALEQIAKKYGLRIPAVTWNVGDWLTADDLNKLLSDIEAIYERAGLTRPQWSFGKFQQVVSAPQLNEIRDSLLRFSP